MNTTNEIYSSGHSKNDQFKFIGQYYISLLKKSRLERSSLIGV